MASINIIFSRLVWSVENGQSPQIGLDPWPGTHPNHILSRGLWEALKYRNYFFLSQVRDVGRSSIQGQDWKSGLQLGIEGHLCGEWEVYVANLCKAHIRLSEEADSLIWDKSPEGQYTPKMGYSSICVELHNQDIILWWRHLWKLHCPAKSKLLWWVIMEDKVPP